MEYIKSIPDELITDRMSYKKYKKTRHVYKHIVVIGINMFGEIVRILDASFYKTSRVYCYLHIATEEEYGVNGAFSNWKEGQALTHTLLKMGINVDAHLAGQGQHETGKALLELAAKVCDKFEPNTKMLKLMTIRP